MTDPVKILELQIQDVKAVKAIHLTPTPSGLTVIGGKNRQGKTSAHDAIIWGLGGDKYAPSKPHRAGAVSDPYINLTLSNGLTVERKGKNSSLSVTDPTGSRGGQKLLSAFVGEFALDLPKFLRATPKEKAQILLRILGIGDELAKLDAKEKSIYDARHTIGIVAESKKRHADELPEYADAPDEPVAISDLIEQSQAVLARNGENQRLRMEAAATKEKLRMAEARVVELAEQLAKAQAVRDQLMVDVSRTHLSAKDLQDESTEAIEAQIASFEEINAQVAANAQKATASDEANQYQSQYDAKTVELETVRAARLALLEGADLPLPGLTVQDGELLYNGAAWDCMSGSEQLRVGTAIARSEKPSCGFVFLDELEKMDLDTLREFGEWAVEQGVQVIATRVSTGGECTIVIEDGLPVGQSYADVVTGVSGSGDTEPKEGGYEF